VRANVHALDALHHTHFCSKCGVSMQRRFSMGIPAPRLTECGECRESWGEMFGW